jgi:hypothetical protein
MVSRVFGCTNSGKTIIALKKLLSYSSGLVYITTEMDEKKIIRLCRSYVDNYYINNNFKQICKVDLTAKRLTNHSVDHLIETILKFKDLGKTNFVVDNIQSFVRMVRMFSVIDLYKQLYKLSIENSINIIIVDMERTFYSESDINSFLKENNLEYTHVDGDFINLAKDNKLYDSNEFRRLTDNDVLVRFESIKCFFGLPKNEIRDKKIDFILELKS